MVEFSAFQHHQPQPFVLHQHASSQGIPKHNLFALGQSVHVYELSLAVQPNTNVLSGRLNIHPGSQDFFSDLACYLGDFSEGQFKALVDFLFDHFLVEFGNSQFFNVFVQVFFVGCYCLPGCQIAVELVQHVLGLGQADLQGFQFGLHVTCVTRGHGIQLGYEFGFFDFVVLDGLLQAFAGLFYGLEFFQLLFRE